MKLMKPLFLIYYMLLILGPLIYLGSIPLASYHFIFLTMFFLTLLLYVRGNSYSFYLPLYFKCYLALLTIYLLTYLFNFFEIDYIADVRDFIIIYAPLQYVLLIVILHNIFNYFKHSNESVTFIHSIIKLHLYIMPVIGVIAIFQQLDLFNTQEILATYYGKINVEAWQKYIIFHPRATATINLEPNSLGLYAAFSLVLFHMFNSELKLNKMSRLIIYSFGIIALMLSGSFTGIIVYVVLTSAFFFQYKKLGMKTIISIFVCLITVGSLLSEEIDKGLSRQKIDDGNIIPSSIIYRIENAWLTTYLEFAEEFINGIGPSAIQLTHSADNDFLDKFLRFGIIGGIGNICFVLFLIYYPLNKRKNYSCSFARKLFLYSALIAFAFALASIPGSAFKAKRLAEIFWILYSLPFIYTHLLDKPNVTANEK